MRRLACALLLLAAACGDNFDPVYWVDEPRVLGVVAEPPEIDVGQATTLTAIVANPTSEPVRYAWFRCDVQNLPGWSGDTATACVDNDREQPYLVPLGDTATIVTTMPDVPLDKLGVPDYTLGLYAQFRLDLDWGDGKRQRTIYRLRRLLPAPIAPNQNPRFRGLYIAPEDADLGAADMTPLPTTEPLASFPANGKLRLQALYEDGSAEGFLVIDGDVTKGEVKPATELLRTAWYSDYGTFSQPTTGEAKPVTELKLDQGKNAKRLPSAIPDEGAVIRLWVVGRDERGGTSLIEGRVRVTPAVDMK